MKIRRLEIQGFKSFVDRVSFDFTSPISAIVGPNGCGKSNVVDAIRWVMGEQSAKNLRGRQMEDVIFSGSESRKPLGMAEVTIVFSTEDGRAPARYLDFAEIEVTRRLYRDGESEYLINRTPCRLMDITELFLDTGVGTRAYSIIEQGRIGTILLSRPEDRRFLIEEAAGVMKYKTRKQIALRKVETTRQNLQRLTDILTEVRRRTSSLQNQARKAEKFRELREELKGIDLAIIADSLLRLLADEADTARQESRQRELIAGLEARRSTLDATRHSLRISLTEREEQVQRERENLFVAKGRLIEAQGEMEQIRDRLRRLESIIAEADRDSATLHPRIAAARGERESLSARLLSLRQELESDDPLTALQERQGNLQEEERELARKLEDSRRALFTAQGERSRGSNQLQNAEKRLANLMERLSRHDHERQELNRRLTEAAERTAQSESELNRLRQLLDGERSALQESLRRESELNERERQCGQELEAARSALSRVEARLHSLHELARHHPGIGEGARSLLSSPSAAEWFRGTAAEFIDAPPELDRALAAACADRLRVILGTGSDSLAAAAKLLRETGGRVFILPRPLATHSPPSGGDRLLDHLSIDPGYADLVAPLFADVFLTTDLESALARSAQEPAATFVTLDGTVVFGGGIVGIGTPGGDETGIIRTKREIREAEAEHSSLSETVARLERRHQEAAGELADIRSGMEELRKRIHTLELNVLTVEKDFQRLRGEASLLRERQAVITLESAQLAEEREGIEREIDESRRLIETASARCDESALSLASLEQALATHRSVLESNRQELTRLQIRIATVREQRLSAEQGIAALDREITGMEERLARLSSERDSSRKEKEILEQRLAECRQAIVQLTDGVNAAEEAVRRAAEEFDGISARCRLTDDEFATLQRTIQEAHERLASLRIRMSELAGKRAQIDATLGERYRITIPHLIGMHERGEIAAAPDQKRRDEIQGRIDQLGEVNLTAIDEYRETMERYDFLSAQKNDLEESLHALNQAIQKINRTTRKRFLETFNQIDAKFREVFPRLFCGGTAELRLTNEEDLLETGIDIIVQPPGKRLQNVSLLSGGEKALTAVALIFAIFQIKPTPFCLLDEVDAPLDDANIGRFNEMVREMSISSQFIIITHSKTTMTVADTLYGVTMEEPGVSRLVSVKLS